MKTLTPRLFTASLLILACGALSSGRQISSAALAPQGWKKLDAQGFFTFYLPPKARDTGLSGTDEFYKEYRVGAMRFMFVHRPMSVLSYDRREREFGRGFRENVIQIDGVTAYLYHYARREQGRETYYARLYVGDFPHGEVRLWIEAESRRASDIELAERIFRTINFQRR